MPDVAGIFPSLLQPRKRAVIAALSTSGVWCLGLLGAVVLGLRARGASGWLALIVAFGLVAVLASALDPEAGWISLLIGLIAGWRLIWRPSVKLDGASAGAVAGLAVALHLGNGVSALVALIAVVVVLVAGVLLVRREDLAGRGEVCLAIAGLGAPVIGFAPDVVSGWRSAQALSEALAASAEAPAAMPLFVLLLIGAALVAGAVRGAFRQ